MYQASENTPTRNYNLRSVRARGGLVSRLDISACAARGGGGGGGGGGGRGNGNGARRRAIIIHAVAWAHVIQSRRSTHDMYIHVSYRCMDTLGLYNNLERLHTHRSIRILFLFFISLYIGDIIF